jgi:phosphatidylserine/phosphatidylglycerophosphate/cardiolipin synthase-like enzyme
MTHDDSAGREQLAAGAINTAVYTSPHPDPSLDPEPAIIAAIAKAKKSILMSAYGFTLADVATELKAAVARGVTFRGVADRTEYGISNSQWPGLVAAGFDILVWGSEYDYAHEKLIVIDHEAASPTVINGSYNFTSSAEKGNRELCEIKTGVQVGRIMAPTYAAQILATYAIAKPPPAPA